MEREFDLMHALVMYPHPCLVKFYFTDRINSIVMEFAESSLQSELQRRKVGRGKYSVAPEAKDWTFQVYWGLRFLHTKHILHRDLKPGNVLVTRRRCKLTDFGGSRLVEEEVGEVKNVQFTFGAPPGSPGY